MGPAAWSFAAHALLVLLQFGEPGTGLPWLVNPLESRRAVTEESNAAKAEAKSARPEAALDDVPEPLPEALQVPLPTLTVRLLPRTQATTAVRPPRRVVPRVARAAPPKPTPAPQILTRPDAPENTFAVPPSPPTQAATTPELARIDTPSDDSEALAALSREQAELASRQAVEREAARQRDELQREERQREEGQRAEAARLQLQREQAEQKEQARVAQEREAQARAQAAAERRVEERRAEERQADERRRVEEQKRAEEQKRTEERLAEVKRLETERATDARRAEEQRQREAQRQAEEQRRLDEVKRAEAEQARREAAAEQARREAAAEQGRREAAEQARRQADADAARQREVATLPSPTPSPAPSPSRPSALDLAAQAREAVRAPTAPAAPVERPPVTDARRGSVFGRVDRDIGLLMYVEAWRSKVERNSLFNMPAVARTRAHNDPVVSVSIRRDGTVEDVMIQRTSGVRELDEAVLRMARLYAPYAAFPPELARRFDVIEIRRVWFFGNELKIGEELR